MTLEDFVSHQRARFYIDQSKFSSIEPINLYQDNIRVSQSFYPALHYFEVILRNKIAQHLCRKNQDWYQLDSYFAQTILTKVHFKKLQSVHFRLLKIKKTINEDNVISELNLGFWTLLFDKRYAQSVWDGYRSMRYIFFGITINPGQISRDLDRIRRFRNRIFHYEQILTYQPYLMMENLKKYTLAMVNRKSDFYQMIYNSYALPRKDNMNILAIETSCDETAAAVVNERFEVLSSIIGTSVEKHEETDGIVPEVAARDAEQKINDVIRGALSEARCDWTDVDAIAVTTGPGLVGSLLVGVTAAKALAMLHHKPLTPVHHITGHICANLLGRDDVQLPALVLTVSGGHTQLVLWKSEWEFEVLGQSIDDAAGECFDKGARLLGLPFPGGPSLSRLAINGDAAAFDFPRPMIQKLGFDFSFSGLKTALLYTLKELELDKNNLKENYELQATSYETNQKPKTKNQKWSDLAASFEMAICESLSIKMAKAVKQYKPREIHLTGGVSANLTLRKLFQKIADKNDVVLRYPTEFRYCTDNAAMIGAAAQQMWKCFSQQNWSFETVDVDLRRSFV